MARKLKIEESELEKITSVCEVHIAHNAKLGDGIQGLYRILKVDRCCNNVELIKTNFRKINEAFNIFYEARGILVNPKTKAAYDKKLIEVNTGLRLKLVDYSSNEWGAIVDYSDGQAP